MKPINTQIKKVVFNKTKSGVNAKMSFGVALMKRLGVEDGTDEERSIKMLDYDSFIILTKNDVPDDSLENINKYVERDNLLKKIAELTEQLDDFKNYLNK